MIGRDLNSHEKEEISQSKLSTNMRKRQQLVEVIFPYIICFSGINAIPYFDILSSEIVGVRRLIYFLFILLISFYYFNRKSTITKYFGYCCIFLWLIISFNLLYYRDNIIDYIQYLVSIVMVFLIVENLSQPNFNWKKLLYHLGISIVVIDILLILVFLMYSLINYEIILLVKAGFNGNRANFSIWLFEIFIINLYFIAFQNERRWFFYLNWAGLSAILMLQLFSGGRIGLICSVLSFLYFGWVQCKGWRQQLYWLSYLFFLVLLSIVIERNIIIQNIDNIIIKNIFNDSNVIRNIFINYNDSAYSYLNRLLSHRFEILLNATNFLDLKAFMFGIGAGNYSVQADTKMWSVHNVFLKILGEFGIFGLLAALTLFLLPFAIKKKKNELNQYLYLLFFLNFFVCMLQPHYFITGLSNCFLYWLGYALMIQGKLNCLSMTRFNFWKVSK